MGWDAGSIESSLDVDLSPFDRGLEEAKAKGREFADKRYTATFDIDTKRSAAELAAVEQRLHSIESTVDRIGAKTGGAGGGAGGRGFAGGGGRGGIFSRLPNPSWMSLGIGAAIPAAVPFAGAAAGFAGGALSAGATGLLGLGAFGLGAKSSITTITGDITKLNKLTGQYNAATTNKQRAAVLVKEQALWKSLDPAQRAAVKNVQSLDSAWASYKKKLEPQTFAVVADGAKIAQTGLKYLLPTAQAVGDEIDILAKRAERAFKAPFWHQFFGDFLPGEAARSIGTLGTVLGHVGTGVGHLVQDFAPLAHILEGGSDSISARFEKWTEGSGPGKFVAWVEKEGPPAGKALEGIATGVKGLAEGFAPLGSIELKALTPVLNFIGTLGDEHPAVITAVGGALLTVGVGLKAIAGVRGIQGILGGIGGLGRGGGLGGGGIASKVAPVHVWVDNWGGGPHGPGGPGGPGGGETPRTGVPAGPTALHDLKTGAKLLRAGSLAEGGRMILQGAARSPIDPLAVVLAAATRGSTPYPDVPNIDYQHRLGNSTVGQQRIASQALMHLQNPSSFPGAGTGAVQSVLQYGSKAQLNQLAELAQKNKAVAAAISQVTEKQSAFDSAVRTSANDIDNAKSSLAHLRAEFATVGPAAEHALRGIPGYFKTIEQLSSSGGFVIGKNLADGITVGIEKNSGQVQTTGYHLVKGVLHIMKEAQASRSPSKITEQYGRWIAEGLAVGFTGYTATLEKHFSAGTKKALGRIGTQLSNAANQYRSDLAARSALGSQISGGIMTTGSIANANLSNTGGATVGGFLAGQINTDRQFSAALKRLRARHLDPRLLQQITDAGPQQGLMLAQSILSGESISGLNKQEKTLAGLAGGIGSTVSGAVFGGTLSKDRQQLARLATAAEHLLSKQLHLSASSQRGLAREIATEFNQAMPYLNLKQLGHAAAIRIYAS